MQRRVFDGLYHSAKFGWNRFISFDNMQVLVFCEFGFKTPIHAPFSGGRTFGAHSPNNVTHRSNPQKDRPWVEPGHLSHKACISGRWSEKKGQYRTGQGRTGKKSQKGYISPIWEEAPLKRSTSKLCR